jgi:hypothetical protein
MLVRQCITSALGDGLLVGLTSVDWSDEVVRERVLARELVVARTTVMNEVLCPERAVIIEGENIAELFRSYRVF